MDGKNFLIQLQRLLRSHMGIPLLVLVMLLTIMLPVPPFVLDVLFSFNITLALIVLLVCVYVNRPLNFSMFPTILLAATLLRLTLNVASTRIVLLHGHQGPGAAGEVIKAFGEVVVGGSFTVGLVVFAILVIINFVVVTKGAGRISEVTARFTLDAMPGKQMAIDADLNAGVISQEEAKISRQEIIQEADFYGSMDGASKFVRGDAIAGLLVLFINLIGGISIGITEHHMAFSAAARTFSLLTIGDGLVAQIPSLLLSSAAAIMVTRVSSTQDTGKQVLSQLMFSPKPLAIAASVLAILALIPGMPHFAFFILAAAAGSSAYYIYRKNQTTIQQAKQQPKEEVGKDKELDWQDVSSVDVIGLEIGYRLISLVGKDNQGMLMARIKGIRKKLSRELGFLVPNVHIRDNLELPPSHYRLALMGVNYGEADVHIDEYLAINPGNVTQRVEGIETKDPTFGLDAYWVQANQKDYAQSLGFTVVDASTVVATHLSQIIREHAADIFGHEETQQLLDNLAQASPKLVESLTSNEHLPLSLVVHVLKNLLKANIPIIDMRTIAEKLVEGSRLSQNPDDLTEIVRVALKRLIVQNIGGASTQLPVGVFNAELEQILHQSMQKNESNGDLLLGLEPNLMEKIYTNLLEFYQQCDRVGKPAVLLVAPGLRSALEKILQASIPNLHILSHPEIPEDKQINVEATIG